jgi:hypothetical protein
MEWLDVLLLHGAVVLAPIADDRRVFFAALLCAVHHASQFSREHMLGLGCLPGAGSVLQGCCVRGLVVAFEYVILSVAVMVS